MAAARAHPRVAIDSVNKIRSPGPSDRDVLGQTHERFLRRARRRGEGGQPSVARRWRGEVQRRRAATRKLLKTRASVPRRACGPDPAGPGTRRAWEPPFPQPRSIRSREGSIRRAPTRRRRVRRVSRRARPRRSVEKRAGGATRPLSARRPPPRPKPEPGHLTRFGSAHERRLKTRRREGTNGAEAGGAILGEDDASDSSDDDAIVGDGLEGLDEDAAREPRSAARGRPRSPAGVVESGRRVEGMRHARGEARGATRRCARAKEQTRLAPTRGDGGGGSTNPAAADVSRRRRRRRLAAKKPKPPRKSGRPSFGATCSWTRIRALRTLRTTRRTRRAPVRTTPLPRPRESGSFGARRDAPWNKGDQPAGPRRWTRGGRRVHASRAAVLAAAPREARAESHVGLTARIRHPRKRGNVRNELATPLRRRRRSAAALLEADIKGVAEKILPRRCVFRHDATIAESASHGRHAELAILVWWRVHGSTRSWRTR